MFNQLKKILNKELVSFIQHINKRYSLQKTSPILFKNMRNFILAEGKRLRPILFIIGYRGFSNKRPKNLYRSALGIELLHDFLLVHDDIVDDSNVRRGKASMHIVLDKAVKKYKNATFSGKDLAIIAGDVMYAIAIESFLSIHEDPERKIEALRRFIEAACYTGCGEFIELLYSIKDIRSISRNHIFKIYDYKTAFYTFITPLMTGAILAGASKKEVDKLFDYGLCLGRAFQIKDDISGIFDNQKKTGKSAYSDLTEGKKTLLIWHAYKHGSKKQRLDLKRILGKNNIKKNDIILTRNIIKNTGSLDYAQNQINSLIDKSDKILQKSKMKSSCQKELLEYSNQILMV